MFQPRQLRVHVVGDLAVADLDAAGSDGGDLGIVRDQGDGAALFAEGPEEFEDRLAGVGVEVARRFVGEDDARAVDQRPGDGDALLLAAGELHGPMALAVLQIDHLERFHGAFAPFAARDAGVDHGQLDVLQDVELRQQVEELEDEPDLAVADAGLKIHEASPRAGKPFVALNCGAIPEALLESELFGHKKGSFTGAIADHMGLFLEADGGTLFLDEIGDMPLALQVKLLRALETREVRPVGSVKSVAVNVRIISASHRDLVKARDDGEFREDLFYRLNVVTLKLPPLRDRREDIPLLLMHFVKRIAARYAKHVTGFSPDALSMMLAAPWPGNIRQLLNVAEQSVALTTSDIVPVSVVEQAMQLGKECLDGFEDARKEFEYEYLTRLLKLTNGSVTQAAKIAKRNRTEFYKLLQRHGLEAAHFKA